MIEGLVSVLAPLAILALGISGAVVAERARTFMDGYHDPDDEIRGRIAPSTEGIIAEAYRITERCPHAYMRSQKRSVVANFAARIKECQDRGAAEAEREERRRLWEWMQRELMGS